MTTLAVLTKPWRSSPEHPPERWPIGRAALALADEGIDVVFTGRARSDGALEGQRARPGRWEPAVVSADGAWDRFPSQTLPVEWSSLLEVMADVPIGNPPDLTQLCRDKVASQRALERAGVRMPELEHRPEHLNTALREWGAAFAKPQHGALGRGVRYVTAHDHLDPTAQGAVPGQPDAVIVQRAIPLWRGVQGLSVRALVQRQPPSGEWTCCPPVVRTHPTDPVANVARGASVTSATHLFGEALTRQIEALAEHAARALGTATTAVELGVDIVVDAHNTPWVIEVNGVPRGHLAALARLDADRWSDAHLEACCRPLRWLATLVESR